jgi:hypothetical protein
MATTGSSSSAATPEGPEIDRAAIDLVVGLATRGAAGVDVSGFVRDLAGSLASRGEALRWRLVVAHAGTDDQGIERVRNAVGAAGDVGQVAYALQPSDALDIPYHGQPGRARALHAILQDAHARGARACVIVDPHSAAPGEWLDHLVRPTIDDAADYVAPVYSRHPFAGALVHGVVYPTFRALYGARLRFPIAADFACSKRMVEAVLTEPIWETSAGQTAIDLWLSATAASNDFRVVQACLGQRVEERTGVDLSTTVSQVVGALFSDMESRASIWQRIRGSRPLPQFGETTATPDPPDVDAASLADSFRLGSRELQDVWAEVLPPLAILQWRRLAMAPLDGFRVDDALWARTVYDFAVGHRQRVIARDHLLRAFTPMYLGWLASFVIEVRRTRLEDAEARIERLCLAFETEKPHLISQWRWPERFRPVKLRR